MNLQQRNNLLVPAWMESGTKRYKGAAAWAKGTSVYEMVAGGWGGGGVDNFSGFLLSLQFPLFWKDSQFTGAASQGYLGGYSWKEQAGNSHSVHGIETRKHTLASGAHLCPCQMVRLLTTCCASSKSSKLLQMSSEKVRVPTLFFCCLYLSQAYTNIFLNFLM